MIDTMGGSLDYLKTAMIKKYPGIDFVMYNYGIGSENVSAALERFDKPFVRGQQNYGALPELAPDVLIVGSYSYNPFPIQDKNKHASDLTRIIQKAKNAPDGVYLLAEIAPLENDFGDGVGGVNWTDEAARAQSTKIVELLENTIVLSDKIDVELIDVYSASRVENSRFGKREYVDFHDNIHPSVLGHTFTAQIIADSIVLH